MRVLKIVRNNTTFASKAKLGGVSEGGCIKSRKKAFVIDLVQ